MTFKRNLSWEPEILCRANAYSRVSGMGERAGSAQSAIVWSTPLQPFAGHFGRDIEPYQASVLWPITTVFPTSGLCLLIGWVGK